MFKNIAACLYDVFLNKLKKTFAHPMSVYSSVKKRFNLHQNPHFKAEPELTSVFIVLRPGVSLLPVLWDQTSLPAGSFGGTGGLLSLSPDYCFKSRVAKTKLPLHALINSGIEQNLIDSEPAKQIGL